MVLDVRSDPDYGGGAIGFFLLTPEGRSGDTGTATDPEFSPATSGIPSLLAMK